MPIFVVRMRRGLIVVILLIPALLSCRKDDGQAPVKGLAGMVFTLGQPSGAAADVPYWHSGDKVAILDGLGAHEFTTAGHGRQASFRGTADAGSEQWFAVYPYDAGLKLSGRSFPASVPSEQVYDPSLKYDASALLLSARIRDRAQAAPVDVNNAFLRFTLEGYGIRSVTLRGFGGEAVSGSGRVTYNTTGAHLEIVSGCDSVRIVPSGGSTFQPGTVCICVAPVLFEDGFSLLFEREEDGFTAARVMNGRAELSAGCSLELGPVSMDALEWSGETVVRPPLFTAENRRKCLRFLENYLDVKSAARNADAILSSMQSDGSWSNIDYASKVRSGWPTVEHIRNMRTLACGAYADNRQDCLEAFCKALDFWIVRNPVCPNWYANDISVPMTLGPAAILIRDRLNALQTEQVVKIMSESYIGMTGQNKVWMSGNVLMRAIIEEDEELVYKARASMLDEIVVTTGEGIQPDWSFHQHGAQLQFGNYGLSFVTVFADWFPAFEGTPLEISGDKRDILVNYIYNGPYRVVWKGYFDMSACGRQVTKNSQKSKANSLLNAMKKLGLEQYEITGPVYYPRSDFGVYRSDGWYASIRMQSKRVKGFEQTNSENMRGYFSSDGALLVRRSGREYEDVAPAWNWRRVPGVTAYDDGTELFGCKAAAPYNKTDLVFGKAEGDKMVAAMDLVRDGLAARKAWFFTPKGIICLGCGISKSDGTQVTTSVDQCRLNGTVETGDGWVRHNGITYVSIDGSFVQAPEAHSGDWYSIHPNYNKTLVTMNLLDIYIDHGKSPSGASYAYVIVPDGSSSADAAAWAKGTVKILSNTTSVQKVDVGDSVLTVDWERGEASVAPAV